jgi:hypothetical protein
VERRPKARRTCPDTPGGVLSDTLSYGILALTGRTAGRRSPAITDRVQQTGFTEHTVNSDTARQL